MPQKTLLLFLFLLVFIFSSKAQSCTTLGQNPSTAFPVCGSNVFTQTVVPICGTTPIPTNCTGGYLITDKNPFWYKFKCFTPGTLGFLITPLNLGDDYDWQLFDVTGHLPNDVYTDPTLKVAHNWSGEVGLTGASAAGTGLFVCAGSGQPLFSSMPLLVLGHDYLLLISHFSDSQSGYHLSFGGGTASITDTVPPAMLSISPSCDGKRLTVGLNKKMKCSSLDPGGSEFSLTPSIAGITSTIGNNCNSGFDFDSVFITLAAGLPAGTYTLTINNGTDGNTLQDVCDNTVPVGEALSFSITAFQPTPVDSISPVNCKPASIQLVFNRPIECSSIATDGSDFTISGPSVVSVLSAVGNCSNNTLTSTIILQLASPIIIGGIYTVHLVKGSDSTTIINECGLPTPAGSSVTFMVKDTVSAAFTFQQVNGCHFDTLYITGNSNNGINSWTWQRDNITVSPLQNPIIILPASGQHTIAVTVSNGGCKDTSSQILQFNNEVKAMFEVSDIICPEDSAIFKNTSVGSVTTWSWDFGDGTSSIVQYPGNHKYPVQKKETTYTITLRATNTSCQDVITKKIRVLPNCYIAVPNAFTPNGDGLNDYLYPLNAFKADNLDFKVYNRWGRLIFHTNDWTQKWDGSLNGNPQDAGVYVWILSYIDRDTGIQHSTKGTTVLVR